MKQIYTEKNTQSQEEYNYSDISKIGNTFKIAIKTKQLKCCN